MKRSLYMLYTLYFYSSLDQSDCCIQLLKSDPYDRGIRGNKGRTLIARPKMSKETEFRYITIFMYTDIYDFHMSIFIYR